jgi:signal transduction histidine kinase/ActR/RegA family two-component response regulator
MLVILAMLAARSFTAVLEKNSRNRSLALIGATALYVVVDFIFIACHLSDNISLSTWKVVAFVFYLIYTVLPFAWHVFVRTFVGSTFGSLIRKIELIPMAILLVMVMLTPFTGLLWYFDSNDVYARGPLYTFYSYLNFFYYVESILDLLIIYLGKKEKDERYAVRAMEISLVTLVGSLINNFVIPMGTIFPFLPFCSVVVAGLSFFFIATKDSDLLKERQKLAIQEALDKAEEASREKTRFLSNMSHDIRTPMNAILNLTDIALAEYNIDTVHEYLRKTKISGKFLLGLINDILDVSRIESGAITLHRENLTRSELLATVDTVIRPMMEEKHLHFHPELEPGEYTISVDKLRFNQIFFNLLSNAAKYTPEGGDVWFEIHNLEAKDGRLKLQFIVRDNGIGMSEEFLQDMFTPFAREQTQANRKTQGTGLGLAIVKGLVDTIGGTISVKSKLGEGTEFIVVFDVDIVAKGELKAQETESTEAYNLKGLHVLLVEDNELNTYVAQLILEKAGCIVTAVENGKKALDAFNGADSSPFDVILMDVRMPVMDGIEATKAIRASGHANAHDIPIIAMTADVFEDERTSIFESGMSDFLAKPISADTLYKALRENVPQHGNMN